MTPRHRSRHPAGSRPFIWAGRKNRQGAGLLYPTGAVCVTAVDGHPVHAMTKSMDEFTHRFKASPRTIRFTDDEPERRVAVTLTFTSSAEAGAVARELHELAATQMGHTVSGVNWVEYRMDEDEDEE